MNQANFQQIINNYIATFEFTNSKGEEEYYKWQIAKQFKPMMDAALVASDEVLPSKLLAVKKLSSNIIDSSIQPFYGICKFAEKEPETVRTMFQELYANNNTSTQNRINHFLNQSLELCNKYYPESYLYKNNVSAITGYLFLYNPEVYYFYKATEAREFADCIEFYDDWGSGAGTKLDVYFRMCEEVVEAIKKNTPLLSIAKSRFAIDPKGMHPDINKHILLYDIMFCCRTHNLFKGIHFIVPKSSERKLMQERKEKAIRLSEALDAARKKLEPVKEGKRLISETIIPGAKIRHKTFGEGIIESVNDTTMTIDFSKASKKKFGIVTSILKCIVSVDNPDFIEVIRTYEECLLHEKSLRDAVSYAERQLEPYEEYLD